MGSSLNLMLMPGIPHSSVDSKLLYTHLGSQMPEPIRARHLIAWCAKRAVDAETSKKGKSKAKDRTDDGDRILNEIMDEFITGLGRGQVDTNVFADIVGERHIGGDNAHTSPRRVRGCCDRTRKTRRIARCKRKKRQSLAGVKTKTGNGQKSSIARIRNSTRRSTTPKPNETRMPSRICAMRDG